MNAAIPENVWEMVAAAAKQEDDILPLEVQALAEQRQKVREEKNWAESDRLRDEIAALGWQVQDTAEGPKLEKASTATS